MNSLIKIILPALLVIATSCNKSEEELPNVLFINVDDLGIMDTGIYGSKFYETPNIDQLASQGLVFTNAYSSAANCAPSRAGLMTGKYSPRHKIYTVGNAERGNASDRKIIPVKNTVTLDTSFTTIGHLFKSMGYNTCTIGKWHLSENPEKYGFEINIAGTHAGNPATYFSPYENKNLGNGPDGEYLTDRLTSEAIKFMSSSVDDPFFLYLPYFTVHTPLQGKQELVEKYTIKTASNDQNHPVYAAMIESLDQNIGRLMVALDSLSISGNTIVIFTADNGGIRAISSQAPYRAGKGSYYEGGIRVPLIFRWPEIIREPGFIDQTTINVDFYPTFLDLNGISSEKYDLDGISLMPALLGDDREIKRTLFWHFPIYLQAYDIDMDDGRDPLFRTRPGSVILEGQWKLHQYFEEGGLELYDLKNDPGERYNLVETHPEVAGNLLAKLKKWQQLTGAPVSFKKNPDFLEKP